MTQTITDEELMSQVRSGVGESLGVLFERYQTPLLNFYYKLTGDRGLSEDLVQEVFFRILKYRHSYRPETGFRAWMYQIARNARVDHWRRQKPETSWEPEMSPPVLPKDMADQAQQHELLHVALMELAEEKREVLVLSRFQDLKYEEIAALLGCEVNTVKVKVFRALRELREIFEALQSGKLVRKQGYRGAGMRPGSGSVQ